MSTASRCPVCGSAGRPALAARDRNRETSEERFTYDRCPSCGTVYLTNVPADLPRYYRGGYYGFRDDGEPDWRGDSFRERIEDHRIELLLEHVRPGRLIEIGAGTGGFAAAAARSGFDVTAVEMDERCCRYISERLGVHAIRSSDPAGALAQLAPARAVAMWHVLEHLPNPAEVLAAAADRLETGGILALGLPNPASLQFRLLRSRWAHLDAPRHLSLIPAPALARVAAPLGLHEVALTTDDPFGRHCNIHGWSYALVSHPARGPASPHTRPGLALARLLRPLERRDLYGSAYLMLLRREDS